MKPTREPYLTKREIATHFGIHPRTVERNKFPFTRVGGQNRYRLSEVEAALAGNLPEQDNVVPLRPYRPKGAA